MRKRRRSALSILLALAMLLTFMPAMAFAEPGDYGAPTAISFTPVKDKVAYGSKSRDPICDDQTGEETGETDEYVYYNSPNVEAGDKVTVTYEYGSGTKAVEYTYQGGYYDEKNDHWIDEHWATETEGAPVLDADWVSLKWDDEQKYEQQFTEDTAAYHAVLEHELGENWIRVEETSSHFASLAFYGDPVAIAFTHEGAYSVEGEMSWEIFDEETLENVDTEPFVYYDRPGFEDGDKATITYEGGQSVEFTFSEDEWEWVAEDTLAPQWWSIGRSWTKQQSKEHPFTAGTTEHFTVYVLWSDDNGDDQRADSEAMDVALTYDEAKDYEVVENDVEATVAYNSNGRNLVVDYTRNADERCNFPAAGDKITITEKGKASKTYAFDPASPEDSYRFVCADDSEEIFFDWYEDCGKVYANMHRNQIDTENRKCIRTGYWTPLNAKVISDVERMSYNPSSISVYSEDIKEVENGQTFYVLNKRCRYTDEDGDTYTRFFQNGEKATIKFKNEANERVYVVRNGWLINEKDEDDEIFLDADGWDLNPGSNSVRLWYHGACTTINVYMDTPQLRAERERAAAAEALAKASNINKATVTAADIKKASNLGAKTITLGTKVKKVKAGAFKGTKITTVVVKTKKLKAKSVKGSLKGSKVKTVSVKVGNKKANKTYVKKYKKIFTKKNAGKKVKVK